MICRTSSGFAGIGIGCISNITGIPFSMIWSVPSTRRISGIKKGRTKMATKKSGLGKRGRNQVATVDAEITFDSIPDIEPRGVARVILHEAQADEFQRALMAAATTSAAPPGGARGPGEGGAVAGARGAGRGGTVAVARGAGRQPSGRMLKVWGSRGMIQRFKDSKIQRFNKDFKEF
jgi:hypothetical protein